MIMQDNKLMEEISLTSIVVQHFDHQLCPTLISEKAFSFRRLRADKIGLLITCRMLSSRPHASPQRLKPPLIFHSARLKPRPFKASSLKVPRFNALKGLSFS